MMDNGRSFVERAHREGIPLGAVYLFCFNRGMADALAREVAEEAANEAYLRALDRTYQAYDHFQRDVTTIAIHWAIDQRRRRARLRQMPETQHWACPAEAPTFDLAALHRAMAQLQPDERLIVRLTFEEQLTLDQIAEVIAPDYQGTPNARRLHVKRRRDVALQKLRGYIDRDGHGGCHGP